MAEEKTLTLIDKLALIRDIADVVKKGKKGFNYTYTDVTEILAKVTAGMKKYNVSLIPSIVPGTGSISQNVIVKTKVTKTGEAFEDKTTEMLFAADMVYKWVNNDNQNETIEVPWFAVGSMSDPSQAMGAAMTYNMRTFLTSYFQIAQSDNDVDAYRSKQKEAEESVNKNVLIAIIAEIDKFVKGLVDAHPEKREELIEFISKYAKSANYNSIKDLEVATNLLNDLKNKFTTKTEKAGK